MLGICVLLFGEGVDQQQGTVERWLGGEYPIVVRQTVLSGHRLTASPPMSASAVAFGCGSDGVFPVDRANVGVQYTDRVSSPLDCYASL